MYGGSRCGTDGRVVNFKVGKKMVLHTSYLFRKCRSIEPFETYDTLFAK